MLSSNLEKGLLFALWSLFLTTLAVFLVLLFRWFKTRRIIASCWFCCSVNSVSYSDSNSFWCKSCKQYNGFTDCGDYNCEIPAMHDARLNPSSFTYQNSDAFSSQPNVFCKVCTHKQEQKLAALSRFTPVNEKNWDLNMASFYRRLESSFALCSSCNAKVRARILQIDSKLLPSFVTWCKSRRLTPKHFENNSAQPLPVEKLCEQKPISPLCYFVKKFLRLSSCLGWMLLSAEPMRQFLFARLCRPHTFNLQKYDAIIKVTRTFFSKSSNISEVCYILSEFRFPLCYAVNQRRFVLCIGLFLIHFIILCVNWRQRSFNPFWILFDVCILSFTTNHIVSMTKLLNDLSNVTMLMAAAVLCLVLTMGALICRWLPYCLEDLSAQKQQLLTVWPSANQGPSTVISSISASHKLRTSDLQQSQPFSPRNLPFDQLSLDSSPQSSHSFRPATAIASRGSSFFPGRCFSTVNPFSNGRFSPPLSNLGKVGQRAYASTVGFGDYRRFLDNDTESHITSVSEHIERAAEPSVVGVFESSEADSNKRRRRYRQRNRRDAGLLRCCIYFLFGRLDSWRDVKKELLCLANAFMVGFLLLMIVHLFHSIFPLLF